MGNSNIAVMEAREACTGLAAIGFPSMPVTSRQGGETFSTFVGHPFSPHTVASHPQNTHTHTQPSTQLTYAAVFQDSSSALFSVRLGVLVVRHQLVDVAERLVLGKRAEERMMNREELYMQVRQVAFSCNMVKSRMIGTCAT